MNNECRAGPPQNPLRNALPDTRGFRTIIPPKPRDFPNVKSTDQPRALLPRPREINRDECRNTVLKLFDF